MAFQSIAKVVHEQSQRKFMGRSITNDVRYCINRNKKDWIVKIVIGEFIMTETGLKTGDRVDFLYDPDDRLGKIIRLEQNSLISLKIGENKATPGRGHLQFRYREGMPWKRQSTPLNSVEVIKEDGEKALLFEFPTEWPHTAPPEAKGGG